ncbi:hypothetical protein OIU84_005394 [Salix udensis]|uniref:Uncharacterized protein n=1 Tax=Salix udensis TaxID=889485 RepID=A0AAD6JW34_9ROSI|nr:hypothetical protein OIU84_005394 [Salix udensis]
MHSAIDPLSQIDDLVDGERIIIRILETEKIRSEWEKIFQRIYCRQMVNQLQLRPCRATYPVSACTSTRRQFHTATALAGPCSLSVVTSALPGPPSGPHDPSCTRSDCLWPVLFGGLER